MNDLSQIKAEIDVMLLTLGQAVRSPSHTILLEQGMSDRLLQWAARAIQKDMPDFSLDAFLKFCPVERRWTRIRSNLSSEALIALHGKLKRLVEDSSMEAA